MHDRVRFADVREELVAEALTLRRPFHEPGNVHELHDRGNRALRTHDIGQRPESRIGHFHHADVGLDGAEWIVRSVGAGGRQRIEERRLADVR